MKEIMKNPKWLRQTFRWLSCLFPIAVFFGIQLSWVLISYLLVPPEKWTMESSMLTTLLMQVSSLLIFGLWYYAGFKKSRRSVSPEKTLNGKNIISLFIIGIGLGLLVQLYLTLSTLIFPDIMADYNLLMDESGISSLTFLSSLITLVLAPVMEEMVFRGITLRLVLKTGAGFWVANIIQALLFGVAHMNLIQGTYAFVLGLFLGWTVKKYHTIFASMIFHLVFNLWGTYGASLFSLLPDTLWMTVLTGIIGVSMTVVGIHFINKGTQKEE